MKNIERNIFNEIKFLYGSVNGESLPKTLDHQVTIEGLVIGEKSVFVNLLIDTCNTPHATTNEEYRPSIKNLRFFKAKSRSINIIEEIGCKYLDFGVLLLNDEDGSFIESIENELQRDSTAINCKILREWSYGRENAKPFEWHSLIETLNEIGLKRLASEIENTLN